MEAASQSASDPHEQKAVLVNEKLRISLTQFAGADGFASLLRRALTLASAEVPALRSAKVSADGHLEGFEQLASHAGSVVGEEAVAITAHLLALLVTFIGEPFAFRLVREAWPDTWANSPNVNFGFFTGGAFSSGSRTPQYHPAAAA